MSHGKYRTPMFLAILVVLTGGSMALGQPGDTALPKGAVARLGSFGFRNGGPIAAMALSRDGKFLATVAPDQAAGGKLWSLADGVERRWYNFIYYQDVVFLPDGKTIVFCSNHDDVRFVEFATGKDLKHIKPPGPTYRIAVSPDGKLLATLSLEAKADPPVPGPGKMIVCLFELATGKLKTRIERKHEPDPAVAKDFRVTEFDPSLKFLAFTADGKEIAAASADRTVTMWEIESGEFVREFGGPRQPASRFAMSADGKVLAAAGLDGVIRGFELAKGKEIFKLSPGLASIRFMTFAPDGKKLAIAGQIQFKNVIVPRDVVWDVATGKRLIGPLPTVSSTMLFTGDGKMLICADSNGNIRSYDSSTGREVRPHTGHDGMVFGLAFSPDGNTLVSEAEDRTIRFWDVKTGKQTALAEGYSISVESSLAFSPDGRLLATRADDNTVSLRDPHNGKVVRILRGHTNWVYNLAFSPDNKTLYSAERDGPTIVWEAQTGKEIRKIRHRFPGGEAVTLAHDGSLLAVAKVSYVAPFYGPHEWGVWDTATGKDLGKFEMAKGTQVPSCFALTPDKKSLIAGTYDGFIAILDVQTGKEQSRDKIDGWVYRLAVSPDGSRFAASVVGGSGPAVIQIWDTKSFKQVHVLPGDGYLTYALTWSPDSNLLATAGGGSAILLWDVAKPPR